MTCNHTDRLVTICDGCLVEMSADRAGLRGENFKLRSELDRTMKALAALSRRTLCDKQYAATEDTYGYCGLGLGHDGPCGRGELKYIVRIKGE